MVSSVMYLARWDGPFVVLFQEQALGQTTMASSLGKMPTTSVRRLISPFSRRAGHGGSSTRNSSIETDANTSAAAFQSPGHISAPSGRPTNNLPTHRVHPSSARVADAIATVQAHRAKDDLALKMPPLEVRHLRLRLRSGSFCRWLPEFSQQSRVDCAVRCRSWLAG